MITHFSAWKLGVWIGGSAIATAVAAFKLQQGLNPMVEVALITSVSSLMVAIVTGGVSIYMQRRTGQKVDGILSKAHADVTAATTRADSAEGFRAGSESERGKDPLVKAETPLDVRIVDVPDSIKDK